MLRSARAGANCPPELRPYTTIYNRFNRWSRQGILAGHVQGGITGSTGVISVQPQSTAPTSKRHPARRLAEKGGRTEGVGRSRGGRTTAIHALTDATGKPRVLLIAPGNVHDVMMAEELLSAAGPVERSIADKAYDTNRLRTDLQQRGIEAVISFQRPAKMPRSRMTGMPSPTKPHRAHVRQAQGLPPHRHAL